MRHGGLEFPSSRGCGNFGVCPIFMASCRPQLLASGFSTCSRYLEKRHQQHGSFAFESSRYKTQIYHGHILSFFNLFKHCAFWVPFCPFLLPFSLVSSSCIFSTRIWRRDFSLQYRKSLVPLYEVEDWLEAGGIDPQTWADQHTWEEQRFPSETKATAWDFF